MAIKRPLEGVRVLEIAPIIFGPLAGQYLGDMGADVIKLEPPEGDRTRVMGPRRSPRLIYCHVAGYGDDGLYAGRAAYWLSHEFRMGNASRQWRPVMAPVLAPVMAADRPPKTTNRKQT